MLKLKKVPATVYFALFALVVVMFLEFAVKPFFGGVQHIIDSDVPLYMWHFFLGVVGAFIVVLGILVDFHNNSMERTRHLETMIGALGASAMKIEHMGLASRLIDDNYSLLCSAAGAAQSVNNTLAFFSRSGTDQPLPLTKEQVTKRTEIIKQAVSKSRKWVDVYSEKGPESLDAEIDRLLVDYKNIYIPLVLNSSYPVVNFTLFQNDLKPEVWFGYGLFAGYDGPVFRSSDSSLCDYFDKYFAILRADSHVWEEVGREDVQGSWISVSYNDKGIQDVAVVWIELIDSSIHPLTVKGNVFSVQDKKFELISDFLSTSAGFRVGGMEAFLDFTFEETNHETRVVSNGAGLYKFSTRNLDDFGGQVFTANRETKYIYGARCKDPNKKIGIGDPQEQRAFVEERCKKGCIKAVLPPRGEKAFEKTFFSHT